MKTFEARTKREKYLLNKLWEVDDELDETQDQYVPIATSRCEALDTVFEKLRLIHK